MSNDKIAKGRHILQMKIASAKHLENPNSDLLKIPLEALHKIALQQIGEQEAYIEELEGQLKEFTEAAVLSRKDSVRIAEEVRREEVIADIWKRFNESQQKNGRLRKKYNELAQQYAYSVRQVEALTQQLRQYSSTTDND
jgi:DNA repair exonuclease SbcCD ATPase subunit